MKAIRLQARGPESLRFEDAPTPRPGPGEVLVRVCAAAVTPTELLWVPTWQPSTLSTLRSITPTHPTRSSCFMKSS